MRIRRFFTIADKPIFYIMLALCAVGLVCVFSAVQSLDSGTRMFIVQCASLVIGLMLFFLMSKIDAEFLKSISKWIYIATCLILLLTLIFGRGKSETGTNGWIRFAGIGIQPAEIAKIGFIISISGYIQKMRTRHTSINELRPLMTLIIMALLPVCLILLQPDFGTAVVFLFIFVVLLFLNGLSTKYILFSITLLAILAPLAYFFALNPAQQARIISFANPSGYTSSAGYNVAQAKMAIGSGGFLGQGYLHGFQTQSPYLPAKHTDFIFACLAEEWGLLGVAITLALFAFLLYKLVINFMREEEGFRKNLQIGVFAYLFFHVFENVSMNLGLMPVTGIPLPFISYGGTSMITACMAIGLINLARE